MQGKKLLLISAFTNPFLDNNNRVLGVASVFQEKGWDVEILTASFSHTYKKFYNEFIKDQKPLYETHFIAVPTYKSNVSVKRLISHFFFAIKTFFYLKRAISQYDLIYSTVPSNLAPYFANRMAKANNIPHVVDIIDIWPESFYVLAGKLQGVFKILSYPWKLISHSLYRNVSILIAASKRYAEFGQKFRSEKVNAYLLGVDTTKVQKLISESTHQLPQKKKGEVWITYGGSLGFSYDFDVILGALEILSQQNIPYSFFFIGGGELADHLQKIIHQKNIKATITGRIDYADYLKFLSSCDIAINSFKKGSLVGYSYKFNDYVATGCCVLNNLQGETSALIEEYRIGINFRHESSELALVMKQLILDTQLLSTIKNNINKVSGNELSKQKIFEELYNDITSKLRI